MTTPRGGRPKIELTQRDIEQIETMAGLGMSMERICLVLSTSDRPISLATLERRKSESKKAQAAWERGQAVGETRISKRLYDVALEGDVTALIWIEKTRYRRAAYKPPEELDAIAGRGAEQKTILVLPEKDVIALEATAES